MKKMTFLLSLTLIFTAVLFPAAAYAQIDVPYIGSWKDGKPYNTDGQPIDISEYYGDSSGWAYDVSRKEKGEDPYIRLNKDNEILEQKSESEFDGEAMKNDPTAGQDSEVIENSKTDSGAEEGTINFRASVPEGVTGSNVDIVILGDNGKRYTVILRKANGYESTETVQAGTYRVLSASLDGDVSGQYSPSYNRDVTVLENGGTSWEFTFEDLKEASESTTTVKPDQKAQDEVTAKKNSRRIAVIAAFSIIIIFLMAVLFWRKKKAIDIDE